MRIVFLAPYVPYPVRHGGGNRTLGLIRCLSRFATVEVLAIGDPSDAGIAEARQELSRLGASLVVFAPTGPGPEEADANDTRRLPDAVAHFRSPALRAALLAAPRPDILHVEEMAMAQYADAVSCPRVVDRQKVEWDYHHAMSHVGGEEGAWHEREAARFRAWESRSSGLFDRILVTGPADREALAPFHGVQRVHVVPIGVDDAIRRPAERTSDVRHVLLYGTLDYPPNVEANDVYFRDVWPRLREALPELRTLVVGSGRPPDSLPRDDPRVEVLGYVPRVGEVLSGPGVLVVPLRVGGGSRTKILEALAAGMPVVSTEVGVENIGLVAGRHYLRAETASESVEAVLRLARQPALSADLGREGAEHIEAGFRWDAIGRAIEPIYREVAAKPRGRSAASRPRVLLIGASPWPREPEARCLSFAGHRAEQFASALTQAGCGVEAVLLDGEGTPRSERPARLLSLESFRAGRELQRAHDELRPDVVVAAGGYHMARAAAHLVTDRPRVIDLAGDLAAEGQLRGLPAGGDGVVEHLTVLAEALAAGDFFTVAGPSQRLALLGQLGLAGRLTAESVAREPVGVVPLAAPGPDAPPPLPEGALQVLWAGGYNTWMDGETLLAALEDVMAEREDVVFRSTGGPIPSHDERSHATFWQRARRSRFADRLRDLGRLPRREALAALATSHVVVAITRSCLEAELGSRQRLVEALAYGRAIVATDLGDLPRAIAEAGAGLSVPAGDPGALASALLRFARDRDELAPCGRRARDLWERRYTYVATAGPLVDFMAHPERWPPSVLGDSAAAVRAQLFRARSDLDLIRSSRTFRLLRLVDRLLGRGQR
jgi:glycosyltransferase involved in cell wall biosynthesis